MTQKRLTREQKLQHAVADLINQMFTIAGHSVTYDEIKDRKDAWYQEWTMTFAQAGEWKAWGVAYLRKHLKMRKPQAEKEMMWVNLQWGLKYTDWPGSEESADKEQIIKAITQRIKEEQKKHERNIPDWHEIAARKIYATFDITTKPESDEK